MFGRYEGYENSWEKACLYAQKVVLKIYMYKSAARECKSGFTVFYTILRDNSTFYSFP